jgi:hypothetical protein
MTIQAGVDDAEVLHQEGDTLVWQSSELGARWLDFPGERTYVFDLPAAFKDLQLETIDAYVASDGNAQANFAGTAGQLAEYSIGPNTVTVLNATCAEYFLYVRVVAYLPARDAGAGDAGSAAGGLDANTGGG